MMKTREEIEHEKAMILSNTFAALKNYREANGITQEDISSASGISRTSIVRLEKGDKDVSLTTFIRYAKAMGLEVELNPKEEE